MSPPLPPDIRRLLIVMPSWVGDAVMSTPLLRALRRHLSESHLIGLMRPGVEEVLAGSAFLDEMITVRNRGLSAPFRLARRLRELDLDASLLLPNSFRWGWTVFLARIPRRVGYARNMRSALLTHALPPPATDRPTPTRDYYLHLGRRALGVDQIEERLELTVTTEQAAAAETLLDGVMHPFILLNPGANRADKRWLASRFAAVADHFAAKGYGVCLTGAPGESEVLDDVARAASATPVDLSRRGVTLGSLKGVIQRAALLITNDTGPRHIAAALGTPCITLFGPTDHRWTTLNSPTETLLLAEPFLPEDRVADRLPQQCRMDRITSGDVIAAATKRLTPRKNP